MGQGCVRSINSDIFLGTTLIITVGEIALKLADPNIHLVLCGKTGHDDWDRYVLQECCDLIDMHSIHIYTYSKE